VRAAYAMGVTYIVSSTDLLVVVPSRLAAACREVAEVSVVPLPVDIPKFQVGQYWHERFHQDPGNSWLRGLVAELFQERRTQGEPARPAASSARNGARPLGDHAA
jgi:DNA-binding transcriptional LysR family regulator